MEKAITDLPLYKIANPDSIAILGASNQFQSMGTIVLSVIQGLGYKGMIYPVHPKEETVLGLKAYQLVEDLPEVPDLAIIVLPTRIVVEAMEACGKKGIRHAIVVSGGFGEAGETGISMQKQLQETAERHGIRFIGPNCIGAVNPHHNFNATFLSYSQKPGFIGMASQSGSFITQMFDYLKLFGLGFSTGFSVGNESDIDIIDCMEYLALCPHTKVIGLYIEGIRRGREFVKAARRISQKKPIVAYYAGGTDAGKKAGFSHTGSMAGPDKVYDGVFRQCGIVRAYSIEELYDFCWCLGAVPLPAGNRVLVQTHSGGPGAVAADACDRAGLVLPPLSANTREKLADYVPHTASMNNPVDLTFTRNPQDYIDAIPRLLVQEENVDTVLMYMMTPSATIQRAMEAMGIEKEQAVKETERFIDDQSRSLGDFIAASQKTFLGFSYSMGENRFVRGLYNAGVPVLPSPTRAARALWAMVEYSRLKKKIANSIID